ncbi:MAG: hypothetical protein A2Y78_06255 [Acidobacteria bacterium RBG_13_68_16]|nr:MAG: hypothetical protein A2Y78_06255 [Acidobacteria bacterium RBG_13_68_16]
MSREEQPRSHRLHARERLGVCGERVERSAWVVGIGVHNRVRGEAIQDRVAGDQNPLFHQLEGQVSGGVPGEVVDPDPRAFVRQLLPVREPRHFGDRPGRAVEQPEPGYQGQPLGHRQTGLSQLPPEHGVVAVESEVAAVVGVSQQLRTKP